MRFPNPLGLGGKPTKHVCEKKLDICRKKIATLEKEIEHLDELFHAMLDALMTGQRSAVPLIDTEMDL